MIDIKYGTSVGTTALLITIVMGFSSPSRPHKHEMDNTYRAPLQIKVSDNTSTTMIGNSISCLDTNSPDFAGELTAFFSALAAAQISDDGIPKFTTSDMWDYFA